MVQIASDVLVKMVKDLEDTREIYHGYSYVRTMRNILTGKRSATIAPWFQGKEYYGKVKYLTLDDLANTMDSLVKANLLMVLHTEHGKLYCTHEYHDCLCMRR